MKMPGRGEIMYYWPPDKIYLIRGRYELKNDLKEVTEPQWPVGQYRGA